MDKKPVFGLFILTLLSLFFFNLANASPTSNWWSGFGEPEYGGTLRTITINPPSWDPAILPRGTDLALYFDHLFQVSWTVDPEEFKMLSGFVPQEYMTGLLVESWEQKDPETVIIHIHKGITFQNKEPVNGRELTASDVKYSYDRLLSTGSGFTKPNPFWYSSLSSVGKVTVKDKYTVEFKFKKQGVMATYQLLQAQNICAVPIIAREWVEQGDTQNWKNAVGSGPWIVTDYKNGVGTTFAKNPDYWAYDERHPENRLPYLDNLKILYIPDMVTAITALRTAKIEIIAQDPMGPTLQQLQSVAKSNPEIKRGTWPGSGATLDMRCDLKPFSDIRVRKALQLAIDNNAIAGSVYLGMVAGKPSGLIQPHLKGWTLPYDEWPEELRAEYTYNPEKAKQLLAEAGYPNGFDTNIIMGTGSPVTTELMEICKAYFSDIGVNMEIRVMDGAGLQAYAASFKHDGMLQTTRSSIGLPPAHCLEFRLSEFKANFTKNNDEHFDNLVNDILDAKTENEAKELCTKADMYLLSQHWSINLAVTNTPVLWQPYVKGYNGEYWRGSGWYGLCPTRIWIDQDMQDSMR